MWLQWQGRCIVAGAWHACPPGLREALRGGGGTACASVVPWGYCCVLGRCVWGQGSYVWNFEGSRQFSSGPWLACWPRWLVFPERTFLQLPTPPDLQPAPGTPWQCLGLGSCQAGRGSLELLTSFPACPLGARGGGQGLGFAKNGADSRILHPGSPAGVPLPHACPMCLHACLPCLQATKCTPVSFLPPAEGMPAWKCGGHARTPPKNKATAPAVPPCLARLTCRPAGQ